MASLAGGLPALDRGEVQLWIVPASGGPRAAAHLVSDLSADERERASRMGDPDAFVIGRAGVRAILARFTSVSAGELQIVAGRGSRPILVQGPDWLDFSFSRCDRVHVCVLSVRRRIGVDVQVVLPGAPSSTTLGMRAQSHGADSRTSGADPAVVGLDALDAFCTPAERSRIARCAPEGRAHLIATLRTQKDALAKAVGAALAPPPDTIETLDGSGGPVGYDTDGHKVGRHGRLGLRGPLDRDDWHVATFAPVVDVTGAVVAEGDWALTCATWPGAR